MNWDKMDKLNQLIDIVPSPMILTDEDKPGILLLKSSPGTIKRPSMTYIQPSHLSRGNVAGFQESEYPLIDIGAAEDTESYIYQAIFKKLALAMKEGYSFIGKNEETIQYIKERFKQLEIAQDQTIRSLIIEVMGTLLRYHSCMLIKARNVEKSGGRTRREGERVIKPVAGYFVASPDTMLFKVGRNNKVAAWKHQMPDGRWKIYSPDDVIYITINKKPHFISPTPPWHPVIEDITALRRIEENVENLIHQHIYPLFQYKVGTENIPMKRFADGLTEADIVRAEIRNMPSDGMIVTPERHEISAIRAEGSIRAEVYLEHFKKRVISGTGMSQLDFGDGSTANRSTADSLSKLAIGNVKFYQQCLADAINFEIIRELLLESTFSFDIFDEENLVELRFTEIDHETQIKLQNNYMLLFQGNLISRTEARNLCGWSALTPEQEEDMFTSAVTQEEMTMQGDLNVEKTKAQASAGAAKKAATNKQQPKNQHGTATGPSKAKSSFSKDAIAAEIYRSLANDLRTVSKNVDIGFTRQLFMVAEGQIKRRFKDNIDRAAMSGLQGFVINRELIEKTRNVSNRIHREFERDVERLFRKASVKTISELIAGNRDDLTIDALEYRIRFIERTLIHKVAILSKVEAMKDSGINQAIIVSNPDGDDYPIWNNMVIDLQSVGPGDLPPFHPNCLCRLEPFGV